MALVAILEVVILVQWYRRWVLLKRAFPLADKRSHTIICLRASLFNVYTWLALAYVARRARQSRVAQLMVSQHFGVVLQKGASRRLLSGRGRAPLGHVSRLRHTEGYSHSLGN
ncbi:hypothetical protein BC834DRAFT_26319 [Gloeopeniophorella convolvens]|nr:hypothetical protein BC834DRAFT_26319 [Gloeopeniophorella convolvens]